MTTDFALIGHQDCWSAAQAVLRVLRGADRAALSEQDAREILPWIPPRPICSVEVDSVNGARAHGFYTGNTLTVSFIVRRIKRMCALERRDLADAKILIIGATGDVGSGCARPTSLNRAFGAPGIRLD